jgi:hypothetical protein
MAKKFGLFLKQLLLAGLSFIFIIDCSYAYDLKGISDKLKNVTNGVDPQSIDKLIEKSPVENLKKDVPTNEKKENKGEVKNSENSTQDIPVVNEIFNIKNIKIGMSPAEVQGILRKDASKSGTPECVSVIPVPLSHQLFAYGDKGIECKERTFTIFGQSPRVQAYFADNKLTVLIFSEIVNQTNEIDTEISKALEKKFNVKPNIQSQLSRETRNKDESEYLRVAKWKDSNGNEETVTSTVSKQQYADGSEYRHKGVALTLQLPNLENFIKERQAKQTGLQQQNNKQQENKKQNDL